MQTLYQAYRAVQAKIAELEPTYRTEIHYTNSDLDRPRSITVELGDHRIVAQSARARRAQTCGHNCITFAERGAGSRVGNHRWAQNRDGDYKVNSIAETLIAAIKFREQMAADIAAIEHQIDQQCVVLRKVVGPDWEIDRGMPVRARRVMPLNLGGSFVATVAPWDGDPTAPAKFSLQFDIDLPINDPQRAWEMLSCIAREIQCRPGPLGTGDRPRDHKGHDLPTPQA